MREGYEFFRKWGMKIEEGGFEVDGVPRTDSHSSTMYLWHQRIVSMPGSTRPLASTLLLE